MTGETAPARGRWRPFRFEGRRYRLVEDEAVRARDLREESLTVRPVDGGPDVTLTAAAFMAPPPARGDRLPPARRYRIRVVFEEVLSLGFDDAWVEEIARHLRRHRMLRTSSGGES